MLKQRINSQLVFAYNGGLFKADEHMVSYAQTVEGGSHILDSNRTPIFIEDALDFENKVVQKHKEILNEYAHEYNKITT